MERELGVVQAHSVAKQPQICFGVVGEMFSVDAV